jgi:hypothetical protein
MASAYEPKVRTYIASGAIKARSFVKFDSSSNKKNPTIVQCESGASIGISANDDDAASGDSVEVCLPGGGAVLKIAGSVDLGNSIKPTTDGSGIVTASAGDSVGAMAVEGGLTGDLIGVHVVHGEKYNASAT